jgi:hypothetical protein
MGPSFSPSREVPRRFKVIGFCDDDPAFLSRLHRYSWTTKVVVQNTKSCRHSRILISRLQGRGYRLVDSGENKGPYVPGDKVNHAS